MVASAKITLSDISRQKHVVADLQVPDAPLTPGHTVGQAIDYYLEWTRIPRGGLLWTAFSRGVKLDNKRKIESLEDTDTEWTVLPEVSAG